MMEELYSFYCCPVTITKGRIVFQVWREWENEYFHRGKTGWKQHRFVIDDGKDPKDVPLQSVYKDFVRDMFTSDEIMNFVDGHYQLRIVVNICPYEYYEHEEVADCSVLDLLKNFETEEKLKQLGIIRENKDLDK